MQGNSYEQLMYQFRNSFNLVRRSFHAQHSEHEEGSLHDGQGMILRILERHDGITQKDLTEMLHIRPSSLSELISKLEAKGYVQRITNEEDKRVSNIKLADKGQAVLKQVKEARKNMAKDAFAVLTEEEQEQLLGLLTKLNEGLLEKHGEAAGHEHMHRHGKMHGRHRHFMHHFARRHGKGHAERVCGDCRHED